MWYQTPFGLSSYNLSLYFEGEILKFFCRQAWGNVAVALFTVVPFSALALHKGISNYRFVDN